MPQAKLNNTLSSRSKYSETSSMHCGRFCEKYRAGSMRDEL